MAGGFFALNWLFLPLAAPFVGSFLGVVASRFPDWESVAFGRSACPECFHRLGVRDLIPIMSWLAQRRSCRYCQSPIETFYPLIEVAALLVAVSATLIFSGWLLWASCLFGWALLAIAATDQRFMLIPDELTLPLIPIGVAINYALDSTSLYSHTAGAFIGFFSFFIIASGLPSLAWTRWLGRGRRQASRRQWRMGLRLGPSKRDLRECYRGAHCCRRNWIGGSKNYVR